MVLSETLVQAGYPVEVINPLVVTARRNITIRGTKTDSADALLIAHLLRETHLKVCAIPDRQGTPVAGPHAAALPVRPDRQGRKRSSHQSPRPGLSRIPTALRRSLRRREPRRPG